ncbi:MAG TPA: HPF/RaiA family ribosome-associated protein [Myxococcales bacterium]|nr:HPF/RaiA family ribosome-associated protein [Myxococcales bacterium]
MILVVRTQGQKLDDTIREFVRRRIVDRLERFYDREAAVLTIELIGRATPKRDNQPECRLTLRMPGARAQRVEQAGADMLSAIDLAGDRLERLAKRELARLREHHRHHWRRRPRTAVRVPESALPPNVKYYP